MTEAFQLFEVQNASDKDCTTSDVPSCTSTSLDDIHMTIHCYLTDNIKMETIMLLVFMKFESFIQYSLQR